MTTIAQRIREFGVRIEASHPKRVTDADGWEHDAYRVRLSLEGRTMRLNYRKGIGHFGSPPQLDEVLDNLAADSSSVLNGAYNDVLEFEEWAAELGYDVDSRKAEATYKAVVKQAGQLYTLLGPERFDALLWDTERL